ncbi:hypothetical protein [Pseudomonas sp. F(2018)]|uniref:hypothetical protein n=1 Tax=Pseudomonas sp. F(2018) TaxID=2502240 RepID=UPI0010F8169D|nr:hypothetical protein [Pseudomonas sp. F(2018)]
MELLKTQGTLPKGIVIAGITYRHFHMREAELADMIEAEADSGGAGNAIHYNAQLAVRQLIKVDDGEGREYGGPFTVEMIKKRGDFLALRGAQIKLDALGNAEPNASGSTTTQSS